MQISVAMASYNGEKYITQQLDSIARQTELPCELVVCDDGSSDRTLQIITSFAARARFPVRVHCNELRMGHADNFLKSARLCKGDAIAFCDQDDVWFDTKLEKCSAALSNPNTLLVMHAAELVGENLQSLGKRFPDIRRTRTAPILQVDPWDAAPGFSLVFAAKLVRSFDYGSRPEGHLGPGTPLGHDHWVYLMASILGQIAFISQPLSYYRRHQNNTTSPLDLSTRKFFSDAMRTGRDTYSRKARLAVERSLYLERLSASYTGETAIRLGEGACFYRTVSQMLALRATVHCSNTSYREKVHCLARLIVRGGYLKPERAGLGFRALAKDVIFTLIRRW